MVKISMPKITPHLCFDYQAEEAATERGFLPAGTVRTVRFHLDGQELIVVNGGPPFTFSDGISLYVSCET